MLEQRSAAPMVSENAFAHFHGGSKGIAMKEHINTLNITLGLIATILGIIASIIAILSMTRPDLLKKLLDKLFPNLEER